MTGDWAISAVKVWDVSPDGAGELGTFSTDVADSRLAGVLTPDNREIYLARPDGGVERVDVSTRRRTAHFAWPDDAFPDGRRLALSPDGGLLAVQAWAAPFPVYDTRTGRLAFMVGPPDHAPPGIWWSNGIDWGADGRRLAVTLHHSDGATNPVVRVLDRRGEVVADLREEFGVWLASVGLGAGDTLGVAARNDRDDPAALGIRMWNWRSGKRLGRVDAQATDLALDSDGRHAVVARFLHGVAEVWDLRSGRRVHTLRGHTAPLTGVATSSDGRRIATSSQDGSARVWDARTGELEVVLRDPDPNRGGGVAFDRGGDRLVTNDAAGVVRIWALDLDELIGIAKGKLTRGLTTPECREYLHVSRCPGDQSE
jgi:WD40 repeat protein